MLGSLRGSGFETQETLHVLSNFVVALRGPQNWHSRHIGLLALCFFLVCACVFSGRFPLPSPAAHITDRGCRPLYQHFVFDVSGGRSLIGLPLVFSRKSGGRVSGLSFSSAFVWVLVINKRPLLRSSGRLPLFHFIVDVFEKFKRIKNAPPIQINAFMI